MSPEIARAHATALAEWGAIWENNGAPEVALLMNRAATLLRGIADGKPVELTPIPVREPDFVEPREG